MKYKAFVAVNGDTNEPYINSVGSSEQEVGVNILTLDLDDDAHEDMKILPIEIEVMK